MVNMPAARQAVEFIKKLPALGAGIHLNLFEGEPVSKDPCVACLLGADGKFAYSPSRLSFLSVPRRSIRNAIATELAAQIQWAIDNGLQPTHLDSHKHIHSFPVIFDIICYLAKSFRIGAIRWLFEPDSVCRKPWPAPGEGGKKKAGILRVMARINRWQNRSFLKTKAVLGIAHTGRIDTEFLKAAILHNLTGPVEIITHPGFTNGLDRTKTRLLHQRKTELDALCDRNIKQYFNEAGIQLVHYGQI